MRRPEVSEPFADPDSARLELSPEAMRAMGESVLERVVAHISSLPSQPVRGDMSGSAEFCRALREPPPDSGTPLDEILDPLFAEWIPKSFNSAHPGYLAYIPGGGLFTAALADLITNGVNRYTGIWTPSPALVQLEANALDWLRSWMGFPPSARGVLTTGGSMAAFNAIVAARERLLGTEIRSGVLYASTQAHHSIAKAARLAGILADRVRQVAVDDSLRLRVDALARAIEEDRANGLRPFFAVSSAGTTNTGAVDPIAAVGDLCAREGLWHHVDGAYGAFFRLVDELKPAFAGLERADSLTLDPHKGLFLPYGVGALLVRDGAALRASHGGGASYLPEASDAEETYDPSQYGPDLTRAFPGLRLWLSLKFFGAARFRAALEEKRALAVDAARRIAAIPGVHLLAPPELSLFAFHLTWPGASLADESRATAELVERVVQRGRAYLTGCTVDELGGRYVGRVCVLSFRTRQEQIDQCVEDVAAEARALLPS